uniref:HTH OST-type domain-containing protein n=1 Tax=Leersia perrieri TaxID=77586 RepID=A0A0D9XX63_9ORYZ
MSQLVLLRRLPLRPHRISISIRLLSSAAGTGGGGGGGVGRTRPQDEESSKAVKVSVWWDFENCQIPNGLNPCRVAPRVTAALRAAGIRGPLSITAFGDVIQLTRNAQEDLLTTGISISHVPHSGKNSSDRSFMADLVYWIAQNPPPAHFFLISGDKDFANILHRLRMSNYNILLACPTNTASSVLCSAATIMWPWEALVKGECFSPKRFNHPPDGLSSSWYGHYKGALDDPFPGTESKELVIVPSDLKHDSIPRYVVTGIQEVLESFPNGVNLSDLRLELKKKNIYLGNDFFGHKKFSCLLQSLPDVVEFINTPSGENQPYVIRAGGKLMDPDKQCFKTSTESDVRDNNLNRATHDDRPSPLSVSSFSEKNAKTENAKTVNKNPPTFAVSSSQSDVLPEDQKEHATANLNAQIESPERHKEVDLTKASGITSGVEDNVNKEGLFKRIWLMWNGPENAKSEVSHLENTSTVVVDDVQSLQQQHNTDECERTLNRIHKKSCGNDSSDRTSSVTTGSDAPTPSDDDCPKKLKHGIDMELSDRDASYSEPCDKSTSVSMEKAGERDGISKTGKGLFSWVTGLMKFGKSDADDVTANRNLIDEARTDSIARPESLKVPACGSAQQEVHEIFTKSFFWDVLRQQLSKPLSSELVSKAKTREELVHQLQKLDCSPLKGLAKKDLHQLVNLLVSEKKWVEETPSRYFPFCLTLPRKRTCVPSNSRRFDGLSSLFPNGKQLQPDKQASDKSTNSPHTREGTLSDCHKLLKDLLLEYEYGFNISIFKLRFSQKHGYELDPQKLGYPDLKSMLQIMPGVRVKFPRVLPSENGNGQAGGKGNGKQSNSDDLVWEELGPVSATTETVEGVDKEMCYRPPTLSEDDFSEDENHADQQPRRETEPSSLLQIIDSWHNSKDVSSKKTQDIDGLVDCSRNDRALNVTRPQQKQYSFVSDSEEDKEKDKLVESVLGSLQKARTSKMHS